MICLWLIILISRSYSYKILLFASKIEYFTEIEEYFSGFYPLISFSIINSSSVLLDTNYQDVSLIIDGTFSEISHKLISDYSLNYLIPTIILGSGQSNAPIYYSENTFYCKTKNIGSILDDFTIVKYEVIWKYSEKNLKILEYLKEKTSQANINIANFEKESAIDQISSFFIKSIKNQGIMNIITLGDISLCSFIEQAVELSHLNESGYFGLYLDECIYQLALNGSIILVKNEMKDSISYPDYLLKSIISYLEIFTNNALTKYDIIYWFNSIDNSCSYLIINIQDSQKKVVGYVNDGIVTIIDNIYYYGGSTTRVLLSKPILTISANTGITNPPGYPKVYENSKFQQGTYFGISKINKQHKLLPNFELTLYDQIDCGVNIFIANYSKECFLNHINKMGYAYIPSYYSITENVLIQFSQLGIDIPVISGMGSSIDLSSSSRFPTFTRLVSPLSLTTATFSKYINIMNWKNIIVFYSNEPFGQSIYYILLNNTVVYGYQILNDKEFRAIPSNYNSTMYEKYVENIQNAVDAGCNLWIFAMSDPTPYFWIEALYDFGIRRGDITIFISTVTGLDAINSTGGDPIKRAELMHGSFVLYNADWIGDYGDEIKKEFLASYSDAWMPSFYIDSVFTLATTFDYLLNQGIDYANHTSFMNGIRNIRLLGCTGTISFDHSSNDRNLLYYNLYNFYQNTSTGQWHGDAVGLISPLSVIYYTILKEPVWPSGQIPNDMKSKYMNCQFLQEKVINSAMSKRIKLGVFIGILLLSIFFTFLSLKYLHLDKFEMLQFKEYASFEDYLTLGFIFLESLQLLSFSPSSNSFNLLFFTIIQLLSMNIYENNAFRDSTYWIMFYMAIIITSTWLTLLLISLIWNRKFPEGIRNKIQRYKEITIPIFSSFLFIPIIAMILSIFSCDQAFGNEVTQSFLNYDCHINCWNYSYFNYAIPTIICFIGYVPLSIYYKLFWQNYNNQVHIRVKSYFMIGKSILLVCIIMLQKIIGIENEWVYGVIFCIVLSTGIIIIYVKHPYNFDRANWWACIMLCGLLYSSIISLFSLFFTIQSYAWSLLQFGGWIILIGLAVIKISRLPPSLLISLEGRTVVALFRFLFGLARLEDTGIDFKTSPISEVQESLEIIPIS